MKYLVSNHTKEKISILIKEIIVKETKVTGLRTDNQKNIYLKLNIILKTKKSDCYSFYSLRRYVKK